LLRSINQSRPSFALVGIAKLVMVILSFVGHLLGIIAKSILIIGLPNLTSFFGYGLVKVAEAVLGIFNFIRHLLASIAGFVLIRGHH
jgi:hypothetical protein